MALASTIIARLFASLLALIVFCLIALLVLLSAVGTPYIINTINKQNLGLELEYQSGSILGPLVLDSFTYQQAGLRIHTQRTEVDLQWSCLLSAEICVEKVLVNNVQVLQLSTSDVPVHWLDTLKDWRYSPIDLSNISAPPLSVPIAIQVRALNLNKLCVEQGELLNGKLRPTANAKDTQLCIEGIAMQLAAGQHKKKQDIQAQVQVIQAQLSGLAIDSDIAIQVDMADDYRFELNGLTTLSAKQAQDIAAADKTAMQTKDALSLYVSATGNINTLALQLSRDLSVAQGGKSIVRLDARFDIQDALLPLDINVLLNNLDTVSAHPMLVSQAPIFSALGRVELSLQGKLSAYNYRANVQADNLFGLDTLSAQGELKPIADTQLLSSQLTLGGNMGTLSSALTLAWFDQDKTMLAITTTSKLTQLDVSAWVPEVSTRLQGKLPFDMLVYKNDKQDTALKSLVVSDLAIQGEWNKRDFALNAEAELQGDGVLSLSQVSVVQGDNQLSIKGQIDTQVPDVSAALVAPLSANELSQQLAKSKANLALSLDVSDLSSLYPLLSGSVKGQAELHGSLAKPKLTMQVAGTSLGYEDTYLKSFELSSKLDTLNDYAANVSAQVLGVRVAQEAIERIDLELLADKKQQSLYLSVPQGKYQTKQKIAGNFSRAFDSIDWGSPLPADLAWQGRWHDGHLSTPWGVLDLKDEVQVSLNLATQTLGLSAHCWGLSSSQINENNKICVEQLTAQASQVSSQLAIEYQAINPVTAKWLENLDQSLSSLPMKAQLTLDWQANTGIQARAAMQLQQAVMVAEGRQLKVQLLMLNSRLVNNKLNASVVLQSQQAGEVTMISQVDIQDPQHSHTGQVFIEQLALDEFADLLPQIERLGGQINGNVGFSGPLAKPKLQGSIDVSQGSLTVRQYPMQLSELEQHIEFSNYSASLAGSFKLGKGLASTSGSIDYSNGLALEANITGQSLEIEYQDYMFELSPDIRLISNNQALSLSGKVDVPYARIKLKTLPQNAKSASSDAVVIDKPVLIDEQQVPLNVDLQLTLDKQKTGEVKLDALDLKANVHGDLQVQVAQQNTRINGNISLLKGEYKAYGQALQIRKGQLSFSGQPELPNLDIEAIRNPLNTYNSVVAGIRVSGTPMSPKVSLFSEPSLEQSRQLSYLLTGQDMNSTQQGSDQNTTLVNALVSYGVGQSENGIGGIGRKLGVKDLNIQTSGQGDATQVKLSGELAKGIKISYGIGVFDSVSEVTLKYQLRPNLYVEAVSGVNNALDVFYEFSSAKANTQESEKSQ